MFGAILGDIIGQPYEFDKSPKTKKFPLFCKNPRFTDDTVMTIAICDGIMKAGIDADEFIDQLVDYIDQTISFVNSMKK